MKRNKCECVIANRPTYSYFIGTICAQRSPNHSTTWEIRQEDTPLRCAVPAIKIMPGRWDHDRLTYPNNCIVMHVLYKFHTT